MPVEDSSFLTELVPVLQRGGYFFPHALILNKNSPLWTDTVNLIEPSGLFLLNP